MSAIEKLIAQAETIGFGWETAAQLARAEHAALLARVADLEMIADTWAMSDEDGSPWGLRISDMKIVLAVEEGDDIILERDERTGLPLLTDEARRALQERADGA